MTVDRSAIEYIHSVLELDKFFRVSVRGGGCSGLSYHFDICDAITLTDIEIADRILADKKSLIFLKDSILTYEKQDWGSMLKVVNPAAKGVCGCGESFSL